MWLFAGVSLGLAGCGPALRSEPVVESERPVPALEDPPQQVAVPPLRAPRAERTRSHPRPLRVRPRYPARGSRALGRPSAGRLVRGVRLPTFGPHHVSWDPILRRVPGRPWRRNGTDRLVRIVLAVVRAHRRSYPGAPRVLIGDLSRPRGGDFSARVSGGIGHASHQNGLDVDVYYPRRDRRLRPPRRVAQIDRRLAQDLVDRFVDAGARYVFVGPGTKLRGPLGVVQPLRRHDNHLHVRLASG